MLTIALLIAGQAPVQLASNDELRWRMFVKASLSAPPSPPPPDRMSELAAAVARLPSDRGAGRRAVVAGPSGL